MIRDFSDLYLVVLDHLFTYQSTYSAELTNKSPIYDGIDDLSLVQPDYNVEYYFESIEIQGLLHDTYTFSINSSIDMYGALYEQNFNLSNPWNNLVFKHHGHCGYSLVKLRSRLRLNTTYIFVMTMHESNKIGSFSVSVSGRNQVSFIPSKN